MFQRERDMHKAADDLRSSLKSDNTSDLVDTCNEEEMCDITLSFDDKWQRGYASVNSVVTAISIENGKCLAFDFSVKI